MTDRELLIPEGARIEGGDLVIDASSVEVAGFLSDPDRVMLRFGSFDVLIPDAAARQLREQLMRHFLGGHSR